MNGCIPGNGSDGSDCKASSESGTWSKRLDVPSSKDDVSLSSCKKLSDANVVMGSSCFDCNGRAVPALSVLA